MSRAPGFTLLEVVVAIAVTGIVALLAYGALGAGFDTRDRLDRYRGTVEAEAIARALLLDALRHPPEGGGDAMNDTLFALEDATGRDGLPMDRLRFFSRGITPPLGATGTWAVSLAPGPGGVRLLAIPVDGASATLDVTLEGVAGLNVRVLGRSADAGWADEWHATGRAPAAVALELFDARGSRTLPPLVAHAALEAVP